jgi:hypothetical protein
MNHTLTLQLWELPLLFWNKGITVFWKGSVPTTLGSAAKDAMTLGVNEALKRACPDDPLSNANGRPDLWKPFLMGGLTGCCLAVVLLPSAIIMAESQVVVGSHNSDQILIQEMMRRGGMKSFAVGLDGQLMRNGSVYAFFSRSYEVLTCLFRTHHVPSMLDELNNFLSGGFTWMLVGWTSHGHVVWRSKDECSGSLWYQDCRIVLSRTTENWRITTRNQRLIFGFRTDSVELSSQME